MKCFILTPLILLSACAPALQGIQRESASLSRDGSAIVFRNPGPDTAEAPALLIVGEGVSVTDASCKPRSMGYIGCSLPPVPAGQQYRLSYTGTLKAASISFYRPSAGPRPIYLELP